MNRKSISTNCDFFFSGVLGLNVVGVAKKFTTRTLFAKHVIKCTTFVALLALCVANNCRREKFFICNPETRVLYARITTSTKVRQNLENPKAHQISLSGGKGKMLKKTMKPILRNLKLLTK